MKLTSLNNKRIIAIGGGKGGSGKSFLVANLGMQLAMAGHKVAIIDVDLGGGNLHTYLGMRPSKVTVGDFILSRVTKLSEVCIPTSQPNLKIVCGPQEYYPFSNIFFTQKAKVLRNINGLEEDFVILDLGPGSAFNVIDFALISNSCLLVILPEPSAIENGYLYMKRLIHRKIDQVLRPYGHKKILARWTARTSADETQEKNLGEFISALKRMNLKLGEAVENAISKINIKIILNQVRTQEDVQMGTSISYLAKTYLGISVDYVGYIHFDENVTAAARKFQPFTIYYPESRASKELINLSQRLLF